MRIRWSRGALRDLESAYEHIASERPEAARLVVERIQDAVIHLSSHPELGRLGRVPGTRELIVPRTSFLIPYRIRGEVVEILSIFHAARKWPESF